MISLAGKAALITGGSRGIGAAAVKLFAQAGADVVFNYVKAKDAALQVQQEAGKHGTRVEAFKADVGKHADNQKLVEHCLARLGRLDILVANAGVWNLEDLPIEKMTEKQWDDMIRINLKSVYSIIHFTVPHMIKQKAGKIIPISSTAGQRGESLHTHYGASKGGIISLTKGLATELARHNILVNSVAPGWVSTDMSVPVLATKAGQRSEEHTSELQSLAYLVCRLLLEKKKQLEHDVLVQSIYFSIANIVDHGIIISNMQMLE